ncbi:hypothetical protein H696_03000 [Fonticula alba]|uniref:Uncharacterized protein n=1 Tax=Fonticula alba TaxID=691883 RepID=A0A058Z8Q7_FONAL|nr:hypothetical protein H696_03000 [Fonticula alba]KCV70645.1 hypothetical protein H696_03000 [Fonticula alba]|eukprot:XP_009495161.1 hypothetical protein H696_03000 [Fonticula alba]
MAPPQAKRVRATPAAGASPATAPRSIGSGRPAEPAPSEGAAATGVGSKVSATKPAAAARAGKATATGGAAKATKASRPKAASAASKATPPPAGASTTDASAAGTAAKPAASKASRSTGGTAASRKRATPADGSSVGPAAKNAKAATGAATKPRAPAKPKATAPSSESQDFSSDPTSEPSPAPTGKAAAKPRPAAGAKNAKAPAPRPRPAAKAATARAQTAGRRSKSQSPSPAPSLVAPSPALSSTGSSSASASASTSGAVSSSSSATSSAVPSSPTASDEPAPTAVTKTEAPARVTSPAVAAGPPGARPANAPPIISLPQPQTSFSLEQIDGFLGQVDNLYHEAHSLRSSMVSLVTKLMEPPRLKPRPATGLNDGELFTPNDPPQEDRDTWLDEIEVHAKRLDPSRVNVLLRDSLKIEASGILKAPAITAPVELAGIQPHLFVDALAELNEQKVTQGVAQVAAASLARQTRRHFSPRDRTAPGLNVALPMVLSPADTARRFDRLLDACVTAIQKAGRPGLSARRITPAHIRHIRLRVELTLDRGVGGLSMVVSLRPDSARRTWQAVLHANGMVTGPSARGGQIPDADLALGIVHATVLSPEEGSTYGSTFPTTGQPGLQGALGPCYGGWGRYPHLSVGAVSDLVSHQRTLERISTYARLLLNRTLRMPFWQGLAALLSWFASHADLLNADCVRCRRHLSVDTATGGPLGPIMRLGMSNPLGRLLDDFTADGGGESSSAGGGPVGTEHDILWSGGALPGPGSAESPDSGAESASTITAAAGSAFNVPSANLDVGSDSWLADLGIPGSVALGLEAGAGELGDAGEGLPPGPLGSGLPAIRPQPSPSPSPSLPSMDPMGTDLAAFIRSLDWHAYHPECHAADS